MDEPMELFGPSHLSTRYVLSAHPDEEDGPIAPDTPTR